MRIVPNLHFSGNCKDAIALYERALGARRSVLLRYRDANPLDWDPDEGEIDPDCIYHAELMIGPQRIMLSDHAGDIPPGSPISLVLLFDTAQEAQQAYAALQEGATILAPATETTYSSFFASLIDRYGVRWELMTER